MVFFDFFFQILFIFPLYGHVDVTPEAVGNDRMVVEDGSRVVHLYAIDGRENGRGQTVRVAESGKEGCEHTLVVGVPVSVRVYANILRTIVADGLVDVNHEHAHQLLVLEKKDIEKTVISQRPFVADDDVACFLLLEF